MRKPICPSWKRGRPGRVVFTNLIRRLMPLIRFPTGDRAQWVEPAGAPDRKFLLLGRAGQVVKIAVDSLDLAEVAAWIEPLREPFGVEQFQLVISRVNLLDQVTFRLIGRDASARTAAGEELLRVFRQRRPDIFETIDAGVLHPPVVEWVRREELIVSERTGKMLSLVDRRKRVRRFTIQPQGCPATARLLLSQPCLWARSHGEKLLSSVSWRP